MKPFPQFALFLLFSLFYNALIAQSSTVALQTMPRPSAQAMAIEEGPEVDGLVINDPLWLAIPAITDFWQSQPHAGQPDSEKTEVRIAYTPTTL